eukprot:Phypoly_transcript_12343.p1 GENE.Phypoly_transcript_12343~~Phypoly_transcript_12343.p1  ORF type:complete len:281 (+),score=40.87 Phypoly_transcript_12343:134-976(+)
MWRAIRLSRPCWRAGVNFKTPKCTLSLSLSLSLVGSSLVVPSLNTLDVPKMVDSSSQTPSPSPVTPLPAAVPEAIKKVIDPDVGWQPTLSDVMHVTKLLFIGGLVWGVTGALIGGGLFKALTIAGFHVTRWISIPTSIFSGAVLSMVGLHRALGHSLIYFIHKGLAGHVLKKIIPKGGTDYTVIHWDAAVSRVTYSFKMKAKKSGFFAGMVLRSLARRLESYLLLVKDEDKIQNSAHLSEDVINHKLTKVIKRQMRKPLYFVGLVYGSAITAVAFLVWRS